MPSWWIPQFIRLFGHRFEAPVTMTGLLFVILKLLFVLARLLPSSPSPGNWRVPFTWALLAANVTIQILKGMKTVYLESEMKSRGLIEAEFRKVLTSYLEGVVSPSQLTNGKSPYECD